ncbi:MAG TPA: hypothetical protein VE089_08085 [Nitrososphaeraceae archaeon]|jgi:hypothetical protein|nr:hypothetical protein [Nitrososphaeraceae archaeon]
MRLDNRRMIFATLLMTTVIIVSNPSKLNATASGIDFYSPNSPPAGVKSLEPLIAKWWNWWEDHPATTATNWPECLKGDGGIAGNNQSIVFLGDPAAAVQKNVNSRSQNCQISSNQLLYLTVYPGECSTGSKPHEGEYPDTKSPADLLSCAQDANKVIKLMQVKVDGNDVSSHIIRQTTSQPFNFIIRPDNSQDWKAPIVGGNNTSMAEDYYLFFKPLPVGDHKIELEVIRQPLQANQPFEHDVAKWNVKVVS